jgi:DNA-binding MarR family transcriptional regulator
MTDEISSPTHLEKQPKDDLNNRIFFKLFQLGNTLQSKSASELGITTVQWAVLGALSAADPEEGISFGELAEYLIVSRQNLDGVLKRLERDGHVTRVQSNIDKRSRNVIMTKSGATFWREKEFQIYDFYRQATDSFSLDDRISLVHFFNKLQPDLLDVKLNKEG